MRIIHTHWEVRIGDVPVCKADTEQKAIDDFRKLRLNREGSLVKIETVEYITFKRPIASSKAA